MSDDTPAPAGDTRSRRGPDPEDSSVFGQDRHEALRRAAFEVCWLLGRGYPLSLAVRVAGDHHQLVARARLALTRGCCSPESAATRQALCTRTLLGGRVDVDAFNVIVTLEVARGGGVLFRCADGALRDLAGMRGSYRVVDDTGPAVDLLLRWLDEEGAQEVHVWIDEPVANSGRLRALFEKHPSSAGCPVEVHMVRDADRELVGRSCVLSADAMVIERALSWANAAGSLLGTWAPDAWVVSLAGE